METEDILELIKIYEVPHLALQVTQLEVEVEYRLEYGPVGDKQYVIAYPVFDFEVLTIKEVEDEVEALMGLPPAFFYDLEEDGEWYYQEFPEEIEFLYSLQSSLIAEKYIKIIPVMEVDREVDEIVGKAVYKRRD